jgi:ribosomal protein S27E
MATNLICIALFVGLPLSRVECPACHNRVVFGRLGLGQYCPECGSKQFEAGTQLSLNNINVKDVFRFQYPQCNACGKKLFRCGRGKLAVVTRFVTAPIAECF